MDKAVQVPAPDPKVKEQTESRASSKPFPENYTQAFIKTTIIRELKLLLRKKQSSRTTD
jgi:hypothetical protein